MAQSAIWITQETSIETKKKTEENKIEESNFEATSDGKRIFTPKQWLERFWQYTKRKTQNGHYRIDMGSWKNANRVVRKRNRNPGRLFMGNWSRSIILNDTGGVQNRTRHTSGERPHPTIQRIFSTKTEYLSQLRSILLDETNQIRNTGRLLAEIDRNRKRMRFWRNNSRRFTNFKIYDRNYGYETAGQINEKEKLELK